MANREAPLAHMVYFTLKDASPEAAEALVAACKHYLSGHEGTLYFSAGVRNPDLRRDVNDREYHVGLHVVFANRAAHDAYQVSPRHQQFIEENKANWERVRVFDTDVVV